jgi:hypothetical protein
VRYKLGFYIPEDSTLHSQSRENIKRYNSTINLIAALSAVLFFGAKEQGIPEVREYISMQLAGYRGANFLGLKLTSLCVG